MGNLRAQAKLNARFITKDGKAFFFSRPISLAAYKNADRTSHRSTHELVSSSRKLSRQFFQLAPALHGRRQLCLPIRVVLLVRCQLVTVLLVIVRLRHHLE